MTQMGNGGDLPKVLKNLATNFDARMKIGGNNGVIGSTNISMKSEF